MENTCENGDRKVNMIVIGESNVGKTSLVRQYIDHEFYPDEKPTVVAETKYKGILANETKVCLEVWDVSGLHDYRSLVSMIFRNLNCSNESRFGLFLVYDVTDMKSFNNLTKWFQQLEVTEQSNIKKAVIGNKIDLRDQIVISMRRGEEFAQRFNADFFETSASNDLNVKLAFNCMIERLLRDDNADDEARSCLKTCLCQ